ncbi:MULTISPECIES: SlyX family protein [Chromohalobacter]|nr:MULTISPECIES: SlyX family protein [Chromohalobacter]MCI0509036.1 SlyX family protein [Chromohalobacter sp.]MCI0592859.1 SlyX family protein [Chromohalobacter sp.]
MTEDTTRDRLDALETRLAYQEDWLDTLDHALAAQDRRVAQLERTNDMLRERLQHLRHSIDHMSDDDSTPAPSDEVPPHY